jgi:uncharacterized DUF497 family protein
MRFTWDPEKAEANWRKHGVAFDEARSVFSDPLAATFTDPDPSRLEERWVTIGYSSLQRLLVVVHVEQSETIRIISARQATAHERKRHET